MHITDGTKGLNYLDDFIVIIRTTVNYEHVQVLIVFIAKKAYHSVTDLTGTANN